MKITALTPTCDRPVGIALLEAMVHRQTIRPDQWIVADGGAVPARCTMGQIHIHDPRPAGALNFATNLLNGIAAASGELLVVIEDDDHLAPTHIETMAAVAARGYDLIGSEDIQRYYNVATRSYLMLNNIGASLCQTAMTRAMLPAFRKAIQTCMGRNSFGIDTTLWRSVPQSGWGFTRQRTVVGIKGLPGAKGLGIGHRPDARWKPDPDLAKLREWIGADADVYAEFRMPVPLAERPSNFGAAAPFSFQP